MTVKGVCEKVRAGRKQQFNVVAGHGVQTHWRPRTGGAGHGPTSPVCGPCRSRGLAAGVGSGPNARRWDQRRRPSYCRRIPADVEMSGGHDLAPPLCRRPLWPAPAHALRGRQQPQLLAAVGPLDDCHLLPPLPPPWPDGRGGCERKLSKSTFPGQKHISFLRKTSCPRWTTKGKGISILIRVGVKVRGETADR